MNMNSISFRVCRFKIQDDEGMRCWVVLDMKRSGLPVHYFNKRPQQAPTAGPAEAQPNARTVSNAITDAVVLALHGSRSW